MFLILLYYGCKQSQRIHAQLQAFSALLKSAWFILLLRIVIDSIGFGRLLELAVVVLNFTAMVHYLTILKCDCLFLQVQFSVYISEY